MAREVTGAGKPGNAGVPLAAERLIPPALHRRAEQLAQSGVVGESSLHPQSSALDAIAHIQEILQTNALLVQQSATLEQQLQTLLAERIALVERIAALEEQSAPPSGQYAARPTACHVVPFRPLATLPAILHHKRLEAIASPPHPDLAALPSASRGRFPHPVISDEETLLGGTTADTVDTTDPIDDALPMQRRHTDMVVDLTVSPLRDYALIAQPFARFTDLGGFQSAVQALPGIHNVRVRRFAQGVLEMRVDYDGPAPLADLLRHLTQPVEEVTQEDPTRLRIRLTPLRERGFPALS